MKAMDEVVIVAGTPSVAAVGVVKKLSEQGQVRMIGKIEEWEKAVGGFSEKIRPWDGERAGHVFIFWDSSTKWYSRETKRKELEDSKKIYVVDHDASRFPSNVPDNGIIIVLGDLFGPFVTFERKNEISQMLVDAQAGNIFGSKSYYVYPLYIDEAVENIIKVAFGFEREKKVFIGTRMSSLEFCDLILEADGGQSIQTTLTERRGDGFSSSGDYVQIGEKVDVAAIAHTLAMASIEEIPRSFLAKEIPKGLVEIEVQKKDQVKIDSTDREAFEKFSPKYFFISVAIGIMVMLLPFLTLAGAGAAYAGAYSQLQGGKVTMAKFGLGLGGMLSRFSTLYFGVVAKAVPLDGLLAMSANMTRLEGVGGLGIGAYQNFLVLSDGIVNGGYDLNGISEELASQLDSMYKETSFLESEFAELGIFRKVMPSKDRAAKARGRLLVASQFASRLPEILGGEGKRTYLVMLQNNAELRPTGGFIGSFALVTFLEGKLENTEIFDVYSADGQLKGFVAPPAPIEEYLGEPAWYLRDSNWDPNFETSAQRAEWFLDKSIDRQVNGVIAVNMGTVERLIGKIGPLEIEDFEDKVDEHNLYSVVQHEVENDFFPGSRKKATYLTALQSAIMKKLFEANTGEYLNVGGLLLAELEKREIQIYMHDRQAAEISKVAGWSGTIDSYECGDNCTGLTAGLVEANVGVNKANRFIGRELFWDIELVGGAIVNNMRVVLTNNAKADSDYGESRYKAYLRVVGLDIEEAGLVSVRSGGENRKVEPEVFETDSRKEIGAIVEVLAGETAEINFSWLARGGVDFSKEGKIELRAIKQSGVNAYPILVSIKNPDRKFYKDRANLTPESALNYNTTLAGEETFSIYWKK